MKFQSSHPNVSSVIADVIADRTGHLFGLMGNGNAHLVSHLTKRGFPFTSARHESSAVTMADGWYRATGKVGAATTTYGAGFTNTYTALAEARMARIPLVLIVGAAPSTGQRAFDVDQVLAAEAVDVRTLIASPSNAAGIANFAFDLALQTFQPVVLAIPYDHTTARVDQEPSGLEVQELRSKEAIRASSEDLERIASRLTTARRPLLLAGRGVMLDDAAEAFKQVGDQLGALFMSSVMAVNVIDSPWNLGIAGGFTRRHRLEIAQQADVVLVAGSSMNPFQTRYGTLFDKEAYVIRVDNEPDGEHPLVSEHVRADVAPFLYSLAERIPATDKNTWREAVPEVSGASFQSSAPFEDPSELGPDGRLNPRAVIAALESILPAERSVVMDGGHFMGWAPMYLSVPDPHGMILVGSAFQSIGLGFGSAAGVSVARPERTTVFITGDGGGLMGLADFETFLRTTRHGVIIVLNDSAYGAELHQYASKGLHEQAMLIEEVDFAELGRALGAEGTKATRLSDLTKLETWLAENNSGVFVLDVAISQKIVVEFMEASLSAGDKF